MESDNENQRLASKVNPKDFVHSYLNPYLLPKSTILDIGCGPAVISEHIALQHTNIKITGLDISQERLVQTANEKSSISNLSFTTGDVYHLPFKDNSFDLVFSRFLFEYLKAPLLALKEMKRICTPGGIVIVQDIDGQLFSHFPKDDQLVENIDNVTNVLKEYFGFDPFIGRKLYYYMYTAQFIDINIKLEPYHLMYGKINPDEIKYWKKKLASIFPKVYQHSKSQKNELQQKIDHFLQYIQREDSLMFSNLFTVYGKKTNE
jgi:ubiquinone/menaquinone biosynthesis C-methylase UbiE